MFWLMFCLMTQHAIIYDGDIWGISDSHVLDSTWIDVPEMHNEEIHRHLKIKTTEYFLHQVAVDSCIQIMHNNIISYVMT